MSEALILRWADAHQARTGGWPRSTSGPIVDSPVFGDRWHQIDLALARGCRGLPGGTTLAELLARRRNVRSKFRAPRLTEAQILKWADSYRASHGKWPVPRSGTEGLPAGERWANIQDSLQRGQRGLRPGSSLAKLLARRRGARNKRALPRLTESQILRWADAHQRRTGRWPRKNSGPVHGSKTPGEEWKHIAAALYRGLRGLKRQTTLARLLHERRGAR